MSVSKRYQSILVNITKIFLNLSKYFSGKVSKIYHNCALTLSTVFIIVFIHELMLL